MAKHDLKANRIQVAAVENREQERIFSENKLAYTQQQQLTGLDLVYRDWVVDFVGEDEFEKGVKKTTFEISGQQSHVLNWQAPVVDFDGQSYADVYGDFANIEIWQDTGSGEYFQVQGNISMTVLDGMADTYTIELDNFNTIIIIF